MHCIPETHKRNREELEDKRCKSRTEVWGLDVVTLIILDLVKSRTEM